MRSLEEQKEIISLSFALRLALFPSAILSPIELEGYQLEAMAEISYRSKWLAFQQVLLYYPLFLKVYHKA